MMYIVAERSEFMSHYQSGRTHLAATINLITFMLRHTIVKQIYNVDGAISLKAFQNY